MEETALAEAPGQESGAEEANAGIMTVEDLAATFVERVETEDASEATETEADEGGSQSSERSNRFMAAGRRLEPA